MKRAGWILAALCAGLLGGCNGLIRDAALDGEIKSVFDQLHHHQDAALRARMSADLAPKADPQTISQIEGFIPQEEPAARTLLSTSLSKADSGFSRVQTADEYRFSKGKLLVQTTLVKPPGSARWQVDGFDVRYATFEQLKATAFTLTGKTPLQYLFLLWVFASPALMIAALVKVIRTAGLKRKWLWGLLAFLGVGVLQMNWMTSQASFHALTIELLGFGIMRALSSLSPWILTATIPVGAPLILAGLWAKPTRAANKRKAVPMAPKAPSDATEG